MKKTTKIFSGFLKESGVLKQVTLGGTRDAVVVSKSTSSNFDQSLQEQLKMNRYMLIMAMILLGMIFLMGVFFVFYYRDQPQTLGMIFGGSFFTLLVVVMWLRKLWVENNLIEMSRAVLQNLPPTEAVKFIETLYWNMLKAKTK